jgi:hypothetical protein
MFIQVIQAQTSDAAALKTALDRWVAELAPSATGWLGTTAGVTDEGTFIALARFESAAAAQANSDRPEQDAWWREVSSSLSGDVTFHDCSDVVTLGAGGSDDAGFVQVIQGRVTDRSELGAAWADAEKLLSVERPDLLGSVLAFHDAGGGFTEAAYFTTEAEARVGEAKELSEEARRMFERERELFTDLSYLDVRSPWLSSP